MPDTHSHHDPVAAGDIVLADQLISSVSVREQCGGICDMTLWRWQRHYGFPKPHMKVGNRNFWRVGDVAAWIKQKHVETRECAAA